MNFPRENAPAEGILAKRKETGKITLSKKLSGQHVKNSEEENAATSLEATPTNVQEWMNKTKRIHLKQDSFILVVKCNCRNAVRHL